MSIREYVQKIKGVIGTVPRETKHNFFISLLIILVGTASFGLGRLSTNQINSSGIKVIIPQNSSANVLNALNSETQNSSNKLPPDVYVPDQGGEVVASKSGTKYHFPWCAGAKQIAEKNLITFASIEEARKAGYTPAANCKGLK